MRKKELFKKKSINLKKNLFISLFIFSLLTFLILLFMNLKQQFFTVPEFIGSFYIISDNKGGKEVMNKNKKSEEIIFIMLLFLLSRSILYSGQIKPLSGIMFILNLCFFSKKSISFLK